MLWEWGEMRGEATAGGLLQSCGETGVEFIEGDIETLKLAYFLWPPFLISFLAISLY